MTTLTVTAKGQVTLGKELLSHLGVRPGDQIAVEILPSGGLEIRSAHPAGRIERVFGLPRDPAASALSIDEINKAIAEGWSGHR